MATEIKKSLHEVRFPGESDEYRRARDELLKAEIDLRGQIEGVAAQRRTVLLFPPNNTTTRAHQAEPPAGKKMPMAPVSPRRDGKIHHFWSSELFLVRSEPGQDMRHVDFMWPLWLILDRTPEGRGTDWRPELDYAGKR